MAIAFQRKSLSRFRENNDYHDELSDQTVLSMGSTSVIASHWLKGLERTLSA